MVIPISIYYQNVRGLRTKTHQFYSSVVAENFDVIAITETWLCDGFSNNELFPSNYVVFRDDRNLSVIDKCRGGGVALAVKSQFKPIKLAINYNSPKCNLLCVKLQTMPKPIYFMVVYILNSSSLLEYDMFFDALETLPFLQSDSFLLVGDLNINGLNPNICNRFNNFINLVGCKQYNDIVNCNDRKLDVVVSNISCTVSRDPLPFVPEDLHHPCLNISVEYITKSNMCPMGSVRYYSFKNANFLLLYNLFRTVNWNVLYVINDVNEAFDKFYEILYNVFDQCVPKVLSKKRTFPVWFTREIILDIKSKQRNLAIYKKTHLPQCLQDYKFLRAKIKRDTKAAYKQYLLNVERNVQNEPKYFWQYVQSKKSFSRIPSEMDFNGSKINGADIANAFAEHFQSVFNVPNNRFTENTDCTYMSDHVVLDVIGEHDILEAINKLKCGKAMGHDNVPAYILKGCKDILVQPLCYLFNLALKTNTFPDVLKESRISPVYKSGPINEIGNYRPIAILTNIAKTFESIIYKYIYNAVKNKISINQYGFQQQKSACGNLINFVQNTSEALSRNHQVDAIYTDFAKAFDKVDHQVILSKLSSFSLSTSLIKLIASYLSNRKQYVSVNNFKSVEYIATSGVPQGSNLGPLLFLMFINDVVDAVDECKILLFADDIKLFKEVSSIDDCVKLQLSLDKLYQWSNSNKLPFNVDKCKTMTFAYVKNPILYNYSMNNANLQRVNDTTDLGIKFDVKLSFSHHMEDIVSKSYRNLGFILRNCRQFQSKRTLLILFNSFVRSKLEYCSIVWNPYYVKYIQAVENIQKKFIKHCEFILTGHFPSNNEYLSNLKRNNMLSLANRRVLSSVIYLYKIINSKITDEWLLSSIKFCVPRLSTRTNRTFTFVTPRQNYLFNSPVYTMCTNFNLHQNCCDIFDDSLSRFRTSIVKHIYDNLPV